MRRAASKIFSLFIIQAALVHIVRLSSVSYLLLDGWRGDNYDFGKLDFIIALMLVFKQVSQS